MRNVLFVVAIAILSTACGDLNPAAPTVPSVAVAPAVVKAPAASDVRELPSPAVSGVYTCSQRDEMVTEFLAEAQWFDTTITTLPSGEIVYIDWLRRVFHVDGPTCR